MDEPKKLTGRGGAGRGQGRKPLPPEERMQDYLVSLPPEIAEYIRTLGTPSRSGLEGNLSDGIRKLAEWHRAEKS